MEVNYVTKRTIFSSLKINTYLYYRSSKTWEFFFLNCASEHSLLFSVIVRESRQTLNKMPFPLETLVIDLALILLRYGIFLEYTEDFDLIIDFNQRFTIPLSNNRILNIVFNAAIIDVLNFE